MLVKEIMTPKITDIWSGAVIQTAAGVMRDRGIGMLPVSENGKLVGTVTDRDIAVRAVAGGIDPHTASVKDIMTTGVVHCFDDEDIRDAAELMKQQQLRRLVVRNRQGQPVGIISLADITLDIQDKTLAGEVLNEVSKPREQREGTAE
ncbi:MAG: CBS domain-containing protein [Gammaproteobacteria bacterium]|jgi:CBS domain-containing protein